MTLSLRHTFTSPKADGADPTQVQPSNWNAEHTITVQAPAIIGRSAAGAGAVSALSLVPVELGGTGASTLTGLVRGNGTGAFTAVTAPTGAVVGTTDTQTLTNKTLTSPTITGGAATALTGLGLRNAGTGAFDMTVTHSGTLTADRALTWNLNDAARTISLAGNVTTAGAFATAGAFSLTLTSTAATNVTLPTTGTLATLAGTETLTNKTLTTPVLSGTASGTTAGRLGYSSGVLSFGNGSAQRTVFTLEDNQTVTSTNVFGHASGQTFLASTTTAQDGLTVVGRAGGTGTFRVTLSPGTLTANRAVTFGDFAGQVVIDSATQTLTSKTLTNPVVNGGVITGATVTAYREIRAVIGASTIDLSLGDYFTRTVSGAQTFTVTNVPSLGLAQSFILDLTNGGSATITWWANLRWPGGTAPTLTVAGRDVLAFYTHDAGANWSGFVLGRDVK